VNEVKAAVLLEPYKLEVRDMPEPQMAPDQIKVKIAYAGVCGTDPEIVEGRFSPPEWEPGPNILGHEAAGTIAEIGADIKGDFKVGQKVAMNFRSSCGSCYYCNNMMEHFCERFSPSTGAMAEYAVYKENCVFPLPDDTPLDIAAFVEPVAVGVHMLDIADMKIGDTVMITGGGTIGQLLLQFAIRSGASRILLSEPVAEKRRIAKEMGADVVVDPLNEDLKEACMNLTDGRGFNICLEASGIPSVAKEMIRLADSCGTIVWCAVYPADMEIGVPAFYMYQKELTIKSVLVSPYSFIRAANMLPRLDLQPLITTYPIEDVVQAFADHKAGKTVKVLLKM
jgi:(R,R)-butanediol dehydrogenase/meso-butanediol dehydrogenase/diacetyl reductase/L-iditol 2-dehydrogenase